MSHSFFAYIFRMRYIARWALMRNTRTENVQEHSYEAAVLSHALAVIGRDIFHKDLNPEAIAAAARAAGERYGVAFLYRDFRPLFQEGQQFARDHGFYMQKYCGCVFSEEERYEKQIRRDRERFPL